MPAERINYTDTLRIGTDKINDAIDAANLAESVSASADTKATQAVNTANLAESKADSTQTQLDTIVINGDSSVEAAQARVDADGIAYTTLKERLDSEYQDITADLAETTEDYLNLGKSLVGGTSDKDNYALLTALVTKAKANGKGLYIPNGKYYCSDNLLIDGIQNIKIDGQIILPEGKMIDVVWNSVNAWSCRWDLGMIMGKVRLSGLKNGLVHVAFADELELYADGDDTLRTSIAYSQFVLGTINTLRLFSEGVDIGWINENAFYGGRIANLFVDGNYVHNNNTFYKPMLENCTVYMGKAGSNQFYDCRFEGTNTFEFTSDAYENVFTQSWNSFKGSYLRYSAPTQLGITVVDNGVGNEIVYAYDMMKEKTEVYRLNAKSENFPLSKIIKNQHSLQNKANTGMIFKSGLIPVTSDFGVNAVADASAFRFRVQFYDVNEQLITLDPTSSSNMSFLSMAWNSTTYTLASSNNIDHLSLAVFKNTTIKYISIEVHSGSTALSFKNLEVFIRHSRRKSPSVPISNAYLSYTHTTLPTEGYFEVGDYVKKTTPTIAGTSGNQYIVKGWTRLTEGTSHVLGTDWAEDRALTGT